MTNQERNDYFYVCALIEYISRATRNHRGDVVRTIGKEGIEKLLFKAGRRCTGTYKYLSVFYK